MRQLTSSQYAPEHQRTFGESRFFIGDVAMNLVFGGRGETNLRFCDFWCCWLATLSSRNHLVNRFLLPTTVAWCTRRSHTPHKGRDSISRAVVACEEL